MIANTTINKSFDATLRYIYSKPNAKTIYANVAGALLNQPAAAADMMNAIAAGRNNPCYHISLSPAQGDRLSLKDWQDLSLDFCKGLGVGVENRQVIAVLHTDATYPDGETRPHLHLVINRFEAPDSNALCLHFPKIERVIRQLEQDYQLEAVPCSWERDKRQDTPGQYRRAEREGTPTIRTQLQQTIDEALSQVNTVEDFLKATQSAGVTTHFHDQGWSFEQDGFHFAGYQLGRAYTQKSIEGRIEGAIAMVATQERDYDEGDSPIAPQQPTPEIPQQPPQPQETRPLSMAEVMRQASEPIEVEDDDAEPEPRQPIQVIPQNGIATGRTLDELGSRIAAQGDAPDGMTIGGTGVKLAGAAMSLADAYQQHLEELRQQGLSDRAQSLLERLEDIGDRTSRIEEAAAPKPGVEKETETVIETKAPDPAGVSEDIESSPPDSPTEDPLNQGLGVAQTRLQRLEESYGLPTEETNQPPIQVDRNASIEKQLDQLERAIDRLNDRLERLETVVLGVEEQQSDRPAPEAIAQSLSDYAHARAEVYDISPNDTIPTRTMGTIQVSTADGNEVVSIGDDSYGAKFEAVKAGDTWEIVTNDLSDEEAKVISMLPQTAEDYEAVANAKDLIRTFQEQAPEQFTEEGGKIRWNDRDGEFSYQFDITTNKDGSQTVIGVDSTTEKPVFQARISQDGMIQTQQSDIPTQQVQTLLFEGQGQEAEQPPEPESESEPTPSRSRQRGQQRELSL